MLTRTPMYLFGTRETERNRADGMPGGGMAYGKADAASGASRTRTGDVLGAIQEDEDLKRGNY